MKVASGEIGIEGAQALIWDLDGTAIDSFGQYVRLVTELAPEFGREAPSRERMLANYHGLLEEAIMGAFGNVPSAEAADMMVVFRERQQSEYENPSVFVFEDAVALSRQAASLGIRQVMVSNREHVANGIASPRTIVQNTALRQIEVVLCGDEVKYRKPDRRVVDDVLHGWGVNPENTVVIGDQWVDGKLAMELGGSAVIVCREGNTLVNSHMLGDGGEARIQLTDSLHRVRLGAMATDQMQAAH